MAPSILALDPGLLNPAAALFRAGRLVAASRVKPDKAWTALDVGERCRQIASRIHEWFIGVDPLAGQHLDQLVIEWPRIYRAGKGKGDPNDLPPLVGVAMCLAGRLDVEVKTYWPSDWIGQVPKSTTGNPLDAARGKLIWRNIDAAEQSGIVLSHDAIDAVGLGLHHLGRLHRRVYPTS